MGQFLHVPLATGFGSRRGLPQRQRATTAPLGSVSTAVPAGRMDWKGTALPFLREWFVTLVSFDNVDGVRDLT